MNTLWTANKGTIHELVIFAENDRFYVDNVRDSRGDKCWYEFPRMSKTIKGCKIAAAKVLGEPQKWTQTDHQGAES